MEHLSQKQKLTIMIAIMAAMFFAAINQTIVSTAMPRISAILEGMDLYTWVITIYLLTATIATIIVGKLSDIYGRKPFLLVGIILFIIGAFLCGTSTTIMQMIFYRGIQGLGGGIIMASAITAVGDLFAPRERAKWTGLLMAIFGFSSILGPALGGWMVDHLPWEWIFWIFLPFGFVAFVLIWRLFPRTERNATEKIDYWGSLFITLFIVPLLLAFTWAGSTYPWLSVEVLSLFGAAAASLLIFILIERRVQSPILPLSLFKNSIVTISNVSGFIMNAGMMGALIYLPFFIQGVQGVSPTLSGYVTMPMSISMIILSALTGRWMTKTGKYKKYAVLSMLIITISMLFMAYMNSITIAIILMIIFGIGLGLGMPVFTLAAQNAAKPSELGVVTASSQLFRNIGGIIGIAVMGSIMQSRLVHHLSQSAESTDLPASMTAIDPQLALQLEPLQNPQILLDAPRLEEIMGGLPYELQGVVGHMVEYMREALSLSLSTVFLAGTFLMVIAFILVIFLKEIPLRTSNAPVHETDTEQDEAAEEHHSIAHTGKPTTV